MKKIIVFVQTLLKSFKRQEAAEQEVVIAPSSSSAIVVQEIGGSASTQTAPPMVFGINRKVSLSIIAVLVVVFLAAFISSFFATNKSSAPTAATVNPGSNNTWSERSSGGNANRNLPANYSELAKYNQKAVVPTNPNANASVNASQSSVVPNQANITPVRSSGYTSPSTSGNYGVAPQLPLAQNYGQPVLPNYNSIVTNSGILPGTKTAELNPASSPIRFSIQGLAALANNVAQAASGSPISSMQQVSATNSQSQALAGYTRAVRNALNAGTIIPAILLTGIYSDLPGQVVAQVRQDVYDSVTGDNVLIPQGSRLVGDYGGKIGPTQDRIGISWKILIFPNGVSFDLGGMAAVDSSGYAGVTGRVDNHEGQILGTAALTSVLAAIATVATGNTDAENQSVSQLAASGATTNLINATTKMLDRYGNVQPTITITPGTQLEVFVNKTIAMESYY